jgi:hypothetical protein
MMKLQAKALVASAILIAAALSGAAFADQHTEIHHPDGSTSTVITDRYGTQVVTPGHGGGQFGQSIPHEEVVKQYTRPGSEIERH